MAYLPKKILLDLHRIASDVHWMITDISTAFYNKNNKKMYMFGQLVRLREMCQKTYLTENMIFKVFTLEVLSSFIRACCFSFFCYQE